MKILSGHLEENKYHYKYVGSEFLHCSSAFTNFCVEVCAIVSCWVCVHYASKKINCTAYIYNRTSVIDSFSAAVTKKHEYHYIHFLSSYIMLDINTWCGLVSVRVPGVHSVHVILH
jgi:hypothetical protein